MLCFSNVHSHVHSTGIEVIGSWQRMYKRECAY